MTSARQRRCLVVKFAHIVLRRKQVLVDDKHEAVCGQHSVIRPPHTACTLPPIGIHFPRLDNALHCVCHPFPHKAHGLVGGEAALHGDGLRWLKEASHAPHHAKWQRKRQAATAGGVVAL